MAIKFKKAPKQSYVEVGDESLGTVDVPVYYRLTQQEKDFVEKHMDGLHRQAVVLANFAKLIHSKRNIKDETEDEIVAFLIQSLAGVTTRLDVWIELNLKKEHKQYLKDVVAHSDAVIAAYAGAMIIYRLNDQEWRYEWGLASDESYPAYLSAPFLQSLFQFAINEKNGNRHDNEIATDEEVKGFDTKKPATATKSKAKETIKAKPKEPVAA